LIARASPAGRHRESDRVFLDANVLFSASYRTGSALERLWDAAPEITLLSSPYAIEEANRNLEDGDARRRFHALLGAVEIVPDVAGADLPKGVILPEKDHPILLAAIAAGSTHLFTGDRAHFGQYFERRVLGVMIQRPGEYVATRR
jgi:uncharacterized protein